jgi:hypothetical protein
VFERVLKGATDGIALDPRIEGVQMPIELLLLVKKCKQGTKKQ